MDARREAIGRMSVSMLRWVARWVMEMVPDDDQPHGIGMICHGISNIAMDLEKWINDTTGKD